MVDRWRPERVADQADHPSARAPVLSEVPSREEQLPDELVSFSFRASRALRKRTNRASAELEVSIQQMASEALDSYLRRLGF